MQLLIYCIAFPFIWLISKLPFKLLYAFSDIIYIILYRIIGYRKRVVRYNLALTLPNKNPEELKEIEKKFYRHLCDMFLETIKTFSISEKELQRRFTFKNIEEILNVEKSKNVMLMFPHYASWEWVIALNKHIESKGYAVYRKLNNAHFDSLIRRLREKFGTTLIEARETPGIIRENQKNNIKSMYGFLSDQSPQFTKSYYWTSFMGIKVPAQIGAEIIAKRSDLAVMYLKVKKTKRGFYTAEFKTLAIHPKEFDNYTITDLYLKEIETQILEEPAFYFWTHKRWKHKDKVPEKFKS